MTITLPLVKQSLEAFAIHILVIANLNHFDEPQAAVEPLQEGFKSVFNHRNQDTKQFWAQDAASAKVSMSNFWMTTNGNTYNFVEM